MLVEVFTISSRFAAQVSRDPLGGAKNTQMNIRNVHSRVIAAPTSAVGVLLDSLAGPDDKLWPKESWPAMRFDKPLQVGARGGHGPIRYVVESYTPGEAVVFRFLGPRGFNGKHGFTVSSNDGGTVVTHSLTMNTTGVGLLSWPLVFRPLHDALLEDALTKAENSIVGRGKSQKWSWYVRCLRFLFRRRKRRST